MLWSTEEFGFLRLADAYATGSSMLPQKKNPDIAELARGKAGRLIGHLTGFLATLKGLPLAYNRDLQEDKEPLFDARRPGARSRSAALTGLLATVDVRRPSAWQAAADGPTRAATDLAEHLVERGHAVPRRARRRRRARARLDRAPCAAGRARRRAIPTSAPRRWPCSSRASRSRRRTTPGGAGPEPVAVQRESFRARLALDQERLDAI